MEINFTIHQEFTTSEAADFCDLSAAKISQCIHLGLITPEHHVPIGSGDRAVLSAKNVRELQAIAKLQAAGIRHSTIKGILQLLNHGQIDWWKQASGWIVILDRISWFITDNLLEPKNKQLAESKSAIIINLN